MKKSMFKVTPKTTKAQLLEVLTANAQNTEGVDKKTLETAAYAVKNPDKATRSDLTSLVKSFMTALGDKLIVPTFAESKPETQKPEDKPETKPEDGKQPETGDKTPEPETKDEPKKSKKSKKDEDKTVTTRSSLLAGAFPETLKIGDLTFTLDHEVKTLKDLLTKTKEFELAFFWGKRHLKQFSYQWHLTPKNPEAFPNDLDLCQLFYVSDKGIVAYAISDYTEGVYTLYEQDIEEFEGMRYSNGIEYQIYSRPADPEPKPSEDEDTDEDTENEGDEE